MELIALQEHTTLVEVEPGEHLYNNDIDRGLFFIESGIMVSYRHSIPQVQPSSSMLTQQCSFVSLLEN
jgi:hypothetical protein